MNKYQTLYNLNQYSINADTNQCLNIITIPTSIKDFYEIYRSNIKNTKILIRNRRFP